MSTTQLRADTPRWPRVPLYARVLLGVVLGTALGLRLRAIGHMAPLATLGELGVLVIGLLKAVAVPLIFFAILDALVRTHVSGRKALKLIAICVVNVSAAFSIGLAIMNLWEPGLAWRENLPHVATGPPRKAPDATLSPIENLAKFLPGAVARPFVDNNVVGVVLLGIMVGAACRSVAARERALGNDSASVVERFVGTAYQVCMKMLEWLVQLVPLAVFGAVAHVVGKEGLEVFAELGRFLVVMLLGLGIHALVYYPLAAWLVGKKSPRVFLGGATDAVLTGLSTNSSLATVPVTLRALKERIGVSDQSARLSACIGTNLNNDGIMLYEAMAALFLCQAAGFDYTFGQQLQVVLAALMAGIGVAGIPEAGYMVLPLVLAAAGLDATQAATMWLLIAPVDWIIARCRSAVNVLGDMTVAILLDVGEQPVEPKSRDDLVATS